MTKFTYLDLKNPFEAGYMGEKITGVGLSLLDPSSDLVEGTIFRFINVAEFSVDDVISGLVWKNTAGKVLARLDGISITNAELEAGLGIGTPDEGNNDLSYSFLVSLLDGPVTVTGGKRDDDDMEVGEGGKAVVKGKAGDDRLYVWHEKDVSFDGGKGVDTIVFGHNIGSAPVLDLPHGAVVDLRKGTGVNPHGGALKLKLVENVIGRFEGGNDIRGDKEDNFIAGGIGADELRGDAGDDTILVKYHVTMDPRETIADGGKGKDTLSVELSDSNAAPHTGAGSSIVFTNTLDLSDPSENTGTFHGGSFKNFETISASGAYYHRFDFRGSGKAEEVFGGAGPDILNGGGGNDALSGRGGADRLTGGSGKDFFRFDSYPSLGNETVITDFSSQDSIGLSASVYFGLQGKGKGEARKLVAKQFFAGAEAHDGDDRVVYDKSIGILYFDADGSGAAAPVAIAKLAGNPVVTAGDIFVI